MTKHFFLRFVECDWQMEAVCIWVVWCSVLVKLYIVESFLKHSQWDPLPWCIPHTETPVTITVSCLLFPRLWCVYVLQQNKSYTFWTIYFPTRKKGCQSRVKSPTVGPAHPYCARVNWKVPLLRERCVLERPKIMTHHPESGKSSV